MKRMFIKVIIYQHTSKQFIAKFLNYEMEIKF